MGALPPSARVRRRGEFLQAQKSADFRVRAPAFLIAVVVREEGPTRLGLVATKKLGGAVERNRAKRRLRALFREGQRPKSVDLVVIPHAEVLTLAFAELEAQWVRAMRDVSSRLARQKRPPRAP